MRSIILHGQSKCLRKEKRISHILQTIELKTAQAKKAPQEAMTSAFFLNPLEPGEIVAKKKISLSPVFCVIVDKTEICVFFFSLVIVIVAA